MSALRFLPTVLLALLTAAAVAVGAAPARAQLASGAGATADAYPNNTIKIQAEAPLVAGVAQTVALSGHAEWPAVLGDHPFAFDLALYVQDPNVDGTCATFYSAELQKAVNLPGLNATPGRTGLVLDGSLTVAAKDDRSPVDWATDTPPFVVRPGLTRVLLCAYTRYVIDDVAGYSLSVPVAQPRCRLTKATISHGRAARVTCNVDGAITARVSGGGRTRTLTFTSAKTTRRGTLPTRSLQRGRYRVTFSRNGVPLGTASLRVR
jgi:hypothetical protein